MGDKVRVLCPDAAKRYYSKGISLLELSEEFKSLYKSQIVAGRVNNDIKELNYRIEEDCSLEFVDLNQSDGVRIYQRSLCFVLIKAFNEIYPKTKVIIKHSTTQGLFCETEGEKPLQKKDVELVEERMRQISSLKLPFIKKVISKEIARELLEITGRNDLYEAVENRLKPHVTVYECGGFYDYFYGYMVPDTSYVDKFSLAYNYPGLIMLYPQKDSPGIIPDNAEQPKLFAIFDEHKKWGKIIGVENMGSLNKFIKQGRINEVIRISEALHEKKIAQVADIIFAAIPKKKIILISGPSSSGKTTFAQRLGIQLRVNGLKPLTISLDDYFLDRGNMPRDEYGKEDFEALEALDIVLFNKNLSELINGKEIIAPVYDFHEGKRMDKGKAMSLPEGHILVIEGIHGLNEKLSSSIPAESKFKIYVSALTSLNLDDHNRIHSTDTRLIRRIVRDHQFRGTNALGTLKMWPSVRRGEKKNIFPFQESADIMFNSSLKYELGVLKVFAEPLLESIDRTHPEYSEVKRLLGFLSYFLPVETNEIPMNSILREFIGGSCFYS